MDYEYKYYWRVATRLPDRKGQRCRVLVRSAMNSCLVEFEDGYRVVTSRNYMRRIKSDPVADNGIDILMEDPKANIE